MISPEVFEGDAQVLAPENEIRKIKPEHGFWLLYKRGAIPIIGWTTAAEALAAMDEYRGSLVDVTGYRVRWYDGVYRDVEEQRPDQLNEMEGV